MSHKSRGAHGVAGCAESTEVSTTVDLEVGPCQDMALCNGTTPVPGQFWHFGVCIQQSAPHVDMADHASEALTRYGFIASGIIATPQHNPSTVKHTRTNLN